MRCLTTLGLGKVLYRWLIPGLRAGTTRPEPQNWLHWRYKEHQHRSGAHVSLFACTSLRSPPPPPISSTTVYRRSAETAVSPINVQERSVHPPPAPSPSVQNSPRSFNQQQLGRWSVCTRAGLNTRPCKKKNNNNNTPSDIFNIKTSRTRGLPQESGLIWHIHSYVPWEGSYIITAACGEIGEYSKNTRLVRFTLVCNEISSLTWQHATTWVLCCLNLIN